MQWLADPAVWLGLSTLVLLEIVLGIDNLNFCPDPGRQAAATLTQPSTAARSGVSADTPSAKTQDHQRQVSGNEVGQGFARYQHQHHRDDYGCHHEAQLIRHPNGSENGFQEKNRFQYDNLRDGRSKMSINGRTRVFLRPNFTSFVDLDRCLDE
jgi:hypothetical protein